MTDRPARKVDLGELLPRRRLSPGLKVRAWRIVLWLLIVSGPVAAVLIGHQVSALGQAVGALGAVAGVERQPDTAGVEGFAELFIATYLEAGEDLPGALSPFLVNPSLEGMEVGSWFASRTTSVGARELADNYYAVVVAAEVVAADQADGRPVWVPAGTRFYSVGVVETETGWVVVGLPALIPAPTRAPAPEPLIGRLDGLDAVPGLEEMLPRFLAALLAGDGELARYLSTSAQVAEIEPPPFVTVEILQAGLVEIDRLTQVTLVVRATDSGERVQVLQYSLVVELRDGRWEVSQLLPAPQLAR